MEEKKLFDVLLSYIQLGSELVKITKFFQIFENFIIYKNIIRFYELPSVITYEVLGEEQYRNKVRIELLSSSNPVTRFATILMNELKKDKHFSVKPEYEEVIKEAINIYRPKMLELLKKIIHGKVIITSLGLPSETLKIQKTLEKQNLEVELKISFIKFDNCIITGYITLSPERVEIASVFDFPRGYFSYNIVYSNGKIDTVYTNWRGIRLASEREIRRYAEGGGIPRVDTYSFFLINILAKSLGGFIELTKYYSEIVMKYRELFKDLISIVSF